MGQTRIWDISKDGLMDGQPADFMLPHYIFGLQTYTIVYRHILYGYVK